MFVKYDVLDMYELFMSEPVTMYEGYEHFSKETKNEFKLSLDIDVYAMKCFIYLTFRNKDVFSASYCNVINIKRKDNMLILESSVEELIAISFTEDFRVTINRDL